MTGKGSRVETVDWRIRNFINLIKLNYSFEYFKTELRSSKTFIKGWFGIDV